MTSLPAEMLAQQRRDSTCEERMVLALEGIAESLKEATAHFRHSLPVPMARKENSDAAVNDWENEGGSVPTDTRLPNGIEKHVSVTYHVGPYRYTHLKDAIEQVRRLNV